MRRSEGDTNMTEQAEPTTAIPPKKGRQHKATYASDKKRPGKYLVRVIGPNADKFSTREVPVTRKDDSESMETLGRIVWTGTDTETGKPVALYQFTEKEREPDPDFDW